MRGRDAIENIKRVLNMRDLAQLNRTGYHHLIMVCGFIAHYDIEGFKADYEEHVDQFITEIWTNLRQQKQYGHFDRASSFLRDFPYTDMTKLAVQLELYSYLEKNMARLKNGKRRSKPVQETLF